MKNYIYILFLLFYNSTFAQVTHFSDTLKYTPLEPFEPYGSFILPLQDGSLRVAQRNTSMGLYLLKTDTDYNYQSYKIFNISDTMKATTDTPRFFQLPSGNHIASIWLRNLTQNTYYNCFMKLNADMSDTISTRTFFHTYNNTPTTSSSSFARTLTRDSTSFWTIGDYYIPGVYRTPTYVARMDTNFNIIAQHDVVLPNLYFAGKGALPRANNRCIINGISTTSYTSPADNICIIGVNDTGTVWTKIMGSTRRDGASYLFNGPSDSTFWLIYTEGRTDLPDYYEATRTRVVLMSDRGNILSSRYLPATQSNNYMYFQIALQLPDSSFLFGFLGEFVNKPYQATFQKYTKDFVLEWQSIPPIPSEFLTGLSNTYINPLYARQIPDGGFLCTGLQSYGGNPYMVWLGRMDSTGCWYDVGCSVATESKTEEDKMQVRIFPNPTTGDLHLTHTAGIALKSYTIADVSGKIIRQNAHISTENMIQMNLPNGIYFLLINDVNGQTSRHKVVVAK